MKSDEHPQNNERIPSKGGREVALRIVPVFIVLIGFCVCPVIAGEKYMSGSPELSAALSGSNEFLPGKDMTIMVMVQNSGLNQMKFVQSGIINRDDLPNTAKLLTVGLSAGDAPLLVKSDPQMVGDLKGGTSLPVSFRVKIQSGASGGNYSLPLNLSYTFLEEADQQGLDSIFYRYRTVSETIPIPIRIKPQVYLGVGEVKAEQVNVGNEGYLTMEVTNKGSEDGKDAVVRISRNGNSPVIPVDTSVYVGDFTQNASMQIRYKIAVSRDAEAQMYPLDMMVTYKNTEGDTVSSDIQTIGVPVGGKIDFAVTSPAWSMTPGGKSVLEVQFRNTGAATAYSAQARISATDPFTSNDDTAFLGDIAPGETATARFEITTDKAATEKEYGLDSELRYRDMLGNSQISDTMKVRINVASSTGINDPVTNPFVLALIGVVIVGFGYYVFVMRKNKSK
jgi:hypothetical protein